jgi:hypothetical protein
MSLNNFHFPPEIYNLKSASKLAPIIIEKFHPLSLMDVGCGNGSWLKVFMQCGIQDVLGVDGEWILENQLLVPRHLIHIHDLTKSLHLARRFDLVLCLEVAEHINEKYAATLVNSLAEHSDLIVFSAAVPGQPGDHHVNLQPPNYWATLFNKKGYYTFDIIRPLIWDDSDIHWWYRQNIFIASKHNYQGMQSENIRHIIHPEFLTLKEQLTVIQMEEQRKMKSTSLTLFLRNLAKKLLNLKEIW